MRFKFNGIYSGDPSFVPESDGWLPCAAKTSSPTKDFVVLSLVGAAVFLASLFLWKSLFPATWNGHFADAYSGKEILMFLTFVIIIHELLHLAAHPFLGFSSRSIAGFWPQMMAPYVLFDGEMSRLRLIVVALFPLLTISIIAIVVSLLHPGARSLMAFFFVVNASASVSDVKSAYIVFQGIPPKALVRQHANLLWWRHAREYRDEQ